MATCSLPRKTNEKQMKNNRVAIWRHRYQYRGVCRHAITTQEECSGWYTIATKTSGTQILTKPQATRLPLQVQQGSPQSETVEASFFLKHGRVNHLQLFSSHIRKWNINKVLKSQCPIFQLIQLYGMCTQEMILDSIASHFLGWAGLGGPWLLFTPTSGLLLWVRVSLVTVASR